MRKIGYIRVSTKDQNLDRQMKTMKELDIEEKHIYYDKSSGSRFDDRIGYQYMKRCLIPGDVLYIHSLDRFGRNYEEIKKEWNEITKEIGADIVVMDIESLDTRKYKDLLGLFISDLILNVLSYVAHQERMNIKKSQREGIEAAQARGVVFGRPRKNIDEHEFKQIYKRWKNSEIKAVDAMRELKLSKTTFYSKVKEYEKNHST